MTNGSHCVHPKRFQKIQPRVLVLFFCFCCCSPHPQTRFTAKTFSTRLYPLWSQCMREHLQAWASWWGQKLNWSQTELMRQRCTYCTISYQQMSQRTYHKQVQKAHILNLGKITLKPIISFKSLFWLFILLCDRVAANEYADQNTLHPPLNFIDSCQATTLLISSVITTVLFIVQLPVWILLLSGDSEQWHK